jgi:hypothetical protein
LLYVFMLVFRLYACISLVALCLLQSIEHVVAARNNSAHCFVKRQSSRACHDAGGEGLGRLAATGRGRGP